MSDSLADLFARDPLKLSEQDLDKIIAYYRQSRQQFMADPKPATAASRQKKLGKINLDDILDD